MRKSVPTGEGSMSIYELKPAFQNLLRPLVRALHSAGCTANGVTIAAGMVSAECDAVSL